MAGFLLASLIAALGAYFIGLYNTLVGLREAVTIAWTDVEALLAERDADFAKLLEICARHMTALQELLQKLRRALDTVNRARASRAVTALGAAEQRLRHAAAQLFAAAANHPGLLRDAEFRALQNRLGAANASLVERRETYNQQVGINNIRLGVFPEMLIARNFGFAAAQPLEFTGE